MDLLDAYCFVGLGYAVALVPRAVERLRVSAHLQLADNERAHLGMSIGVVLLATMAWPLMLLIKLTMAFRELPKAMLIPFVDEDWEDDDGGEDEADDEEAAPGGGGCCQAGVEGDGCLGRDVSLPSSGQDDAGKLGSVVRGEGPHRGQPRVAVRDDLPGVRGAARGQPDVDAPAQPPKRSGAAGGENA